MAIAHSRALAALSATHVPTGPSLVTRGAFPPPRGAPGCVWQHGWCLSAITGSTAPPCSATFPPGHCSAGHRWRSRSTDRRSTLLLNPSKRARTPAPTVGPTRRLSCRRGCSSPPCRSLEGTFVIAVMADFPTRLHSAERTSPLCSRGIPRRTARRACRRPALPSGQHGLTSIRAVGSPQSKHQGSGNRV